MQGLPLPPSARRLHSLPSRIGVDRSRPARGDGGHGALSAAEGTGSFQIEDEHRQAPRHGPQLPEAVRHVLAMQ